MLNQTMCVGVILAGGPLQRMGGGDKCQLDLDEKTIVCRLPWQGAISVEDITE